MKILLILPLAVSLASCATTSTPPSTPQNSAVPSGFVKAADGTLYAANDVPAGVKAAAVMAEPATPAVAPVTATGRKKFWTPERRETLLLALMGASSAASSYFNAQSAAYSAQSAAYSAQAASYSSMRNNYGYAPYAPTLGRISPYANDTLRLRPSFGDRWNDQNGMSYRIQEDPLGLSVNGTVYKVTASDGTEYRAKPTLTPGKYNLEPR
jgi:hypothetical protein